MYSASVGRGDKKWDRGEVFGYNFDVKGHRVVDWGIVEVDYPAKYIVIGVVYGIVADEGGYDGAEGRVSCCGDWV